MDKLLDIIYLAGLGLVICGVIWRFNQVWKSTVKHDLYCYEFEKAIKACLSDGAKTRQQIKEWIIQRNPELSAVADRFIPYVLKHFIRNGKVSTVDRFDTSLQGNSRFYFLIISE